MKRIVEGVRFLKICGMPRPTLISSLSTDVSFPNDSIFIIFETVDYSLSGQFVVQKVNNGDQKIDLLRIDSI